MRCLENFAIHRNERNKNNNLNDDSDNRKATLCNKYGILHTHYSVYTIERLCVFIEFRK